MSMNNNNNKTARNKSDPCHRTGHHLWQCVQTSTYQSHRIEFYIFFHLLLFNLQWTKFIQFNIPKIFDNGIHALRRTVFFCLNQNLICTYFSVHCIYEVNIPAWPYSTFECLSGESGESKNAGTAFFYYELFLHVYYEEFISCSGSHHTFLPPEIFLRFFFLYGLIWWQGKKQFSISNFLTMIRYIYLNSCKDEAQLKMHSAHTFITLQSHIPGGIVSSPGRSFWQHLR